MQGSSSSGMCRNVSRGALCAGIDSEESRRLFKFGRRKTTNK